MTEDVKPKNLNDMVIVGINMAILLIYSIITFTQEGGILADAFFIFIHIISCLIIGAIQRRIAWALSAFLVLSIGLATCVKFSKGL